RLASADPLEHPLIDPNYLAEEYDRAMSIGGFRLAREIMAQPAFRPYLRAERLPGPDVRSDAEILAYARQHGKTDYHPVGTCKMGTDELAVVDPALRVRGIERLRVCDSSIMPRLVSSNTNAPTLMIGEKAADLIKEVHERPAPAPKELQTATRAEQRPRRRRDAARRRRAGRGAGAPRVARPSSLRTDLHAVDLAERAGQRRDIALALALGDRERVDLMHRLAQERGAADRLGQVRVVPDVLLAVLELEHHAAVLAEHPGHEALEHRRVGAADADHVEQHL